MLESVGWTAKFEERESAGEIIRDVIDQAPPTYWRRKRGGQLKTWLSMLKEDLTRMSGPKIYRLRRWNWEWLSLGIPCTQNRQARTAALQKVVVKAGTTPSG